jgi:hypothetical protein
MIPNFFSKQEIPKEIPAGMQEIVNKLKKCKTKEECLKTAYDELTKSHSGSMYGVWKYFPTLFIRNINKLWKRKKLVCTNLTYLMRVLLIKSGKFTEKDVKYQTKISIIRPHVFLRANVGDKWVNVDAWGKANGIPFGEYATSKRWILGVFSIFTKK